MKLFVRHQPREGEAVILVLDYDDTILNMLKSLLGQHGHQVIIVESSEAAIAALNQGDITKVMAHWRLDDRGACGRVLQAAVIAGLDHADLCVTTNNPVLLAEVRRNEPRFRYLLERITILMKPYRLQQVLAFAQPAN